MSEYNHTLTIVTGAAVTLTFSNTMRDDIRFRQMSAKFAGEQHPDSHIRSDFCWFVSRMATVDGTDWQPVTESATEKQFEQCYYAFTKLVDDAGFYGCVKAVNALKTRPDAVEKPDDQLTPAEQADPN